MRRIAAAIFTPLLAIAVLTGCSSSNGSSGANSEVTASSGFGKAPTVTFPSQGAGSDLYIKTETEGTGQALGSTGGFLGNYLVYIWSGTKHTLATSTYTSAPTVLSTQLLPGLKTALVGKKMGSRVLAVVPPKYGYGSQGDSSLGVSGSDTLVFVVDLIKAYPATASVSGTQTSNGGGTLPTVAAATPGTAPTITVPSSSAKPPGSLVVKTLIKGSGPAVAKGQVVVTQYVGLDWNTNKVFDSSWEHGSPVSFQVGLTSAEVIPGWNTGLVGVPVGSRVMLVIPPADGYGSSGNSSASIAGTDTLVFVIDVLDAVNPNSAK
jgi:FKBP-type peptidyl-prolyl cis-trans isomerase